MEVDPPQTSAGNNVPSASTTSATAVNQEPKAGTSKETSAQESDTDFLQTGRVGRRNASKS